MSRRDAALNGGRRDRHQRQNAAINRGSWHRTRENAAENRGTDLRGSVSVQRSIVVRILA
eukprot:2648988-Rhodomonas_salina.1